jgi:hypothetical protein
MRAIPGQYRTFNDKAHLARDLRTFQFVCISKPNKKSIAALFSLSLNKSLNDYRERIVLRIRSSDWWSAPEPADPLEKRIWAGRAALLDAIYYDAYTRRRQRRGGPTNPRGRVACVGQRYRAQRFHSKLKLTAPPMKLPPEKVAVRHGRTACYQVAAGALGAFLWATCTLWVL